MKLGSHVSLGGNDKFLGSVQEALSYNANCLMVYTGAPQNTSRLPLSKLKIPEAWALMAINRIEKTDVFVHAPYIVNLANPDIEKQQFAIQFLTEELIRTTGLGANVMILHPGNHLNRGCEYGIELIAQGINQLHRNTQGDSTIIAIESMSGKGTEVGKTFEELQAIIDLIEDKNRIGVCLDSCHLHDAGYDVQTGFSQVIDEFDRVIGIDKLQVFHLNDSKNIRGVAKDRHANIGFGQIGFPAICEILNHPRILHVAKILETPYVSNPANPKLSYPPYKYEIAMLKAGVFQPDLMDVIVLAEG